MEGQVVNYADNIAYLIQDINDFEAVGIFDRETKERYERSLSEFEFEDTNKRFPISGVVGKTVSLRTATLIERYVSNVQECLSNDSLTKISSPFFEESIPRLEIEPILKRAIDACWDFKKEFYETELINVSNMASKTKMEQLWEILDKNSAFVEYNNSYKSFNEFLSSPIFASFKKEKNIVDDDIWGAWKKAFFIAHLTCDDIDLIIKSFLERDYVFELSLPIINRN